MSLSHRLASGFIWILYQWLTNSDAHLIKILFFLETVPGKLLKRKEGALSGPQAMAVDSSAFRQLPITSVPVHERFFYK